MADAAATPRVTIVAANEASWEDLQTVLGTRGDPSRCQCQRYKMQPKESWASVGREPPRRCAPPRRAAPRSTRRRAPPPSPRTRASARSSSSAGRGPAPPPGCPSRTARSAPPPPRAWPCGTFHIQVPGPMYTVLGHPPGEVAAVSARAEVVAVAGGAGLPGSRRSARCARSRGTSSSARTAGGDRTPPGRRDDPLAGGRAQVRPPADVQHPRRRLVPHDHRQVQVQRVADILVAVQAELEIPARPTPSSAPSSGCGASG